MKCNRILLFFLVIGGIFASCHENTDKQTVQKELEKIVGKKLLFPDSLSLRLLGECITDSGSLKRNSVKIVSYFTPFLCSSCNLDIFEKWKIIIEGVTFSFGDVVDFVFIFDQRKNGEAELTEALKASYFNHPVYYDRGYFVRLNTFVPPNPLYHTFLTDIDNNIILVGNPVWNRRIKKLYISTLENMFPQ